MRCVTAIYVDDLAISADTATEVFAIYEWVVKLLGEAHFQVKKWASNSQALLKNLDPSTLAPTEVDVHSSLKNITSSDTSTLGAQWDPKPITSTLPDAVWVQGTMRTLSLVLRPCSPDLSI